jgi:hypothetical protein
MAPLNLKSQITDAQQVQYLLEHGAELGKSRYMYNSWNKLLVEVNLRGHQSVKKLIEATLKDRYNSKCTKRTCAPRSRNPNAPEGSEWATAKATAERQNDPEMKKLFE